MAEGDGALYNSFKQQLPKGEHNFSGNAHNFRVALFTGAFTPNKDTQTMYSDLTEECVGAGYTAGGNLIANVDVAIDLATDTALVDADNTTWNNLGQLDPQPAWAVLYNDTHVNKALVAYWQVTTATNGGNWELQFSSSPSAIFTLS